jgi:hypothetical protein
MQKFARHGSIKLMYIITNFVMKLRVCISEEEKNTVFDNLETRHR